MKKLLIITYYWPPSAGVGVQRWLKFSKFLPENGWQPIIVTPENPQFNVQDTSLEKDIPTEALVYKLPIWEPFSLFNKLSGGKEKKEVKQGLILEGGKKNWKSDVIVWLRGNLFVPDPRMFWKKTVLQFLNNHPELSFDAMVTTGPPHSMHLIGLAIKKRYGIKWVADFRDPWSKWDMLHNLKVSEFTLNRHRSLERKVFKNADKILTVSPLLEADLKQLGAKSTSHITNGFDPDDLPEMQDTPPKKFLWSHIGLLNELRNPSQLWQAFEECLSADDELAATFELLLGGIVSPVVKNEIEGYPLLRERVVYEGYLAHKEMFQKCRDSAALLVIQNKSENAPWIIPAKIFEYMAVKRPLLQVGPVGADADKIISNAGVGRTVAHTDLESMKKVIADYFNSYKEGKFETASHESEKYTRRALTKQFSELLNAL